MGITSTITHRLLTLSRPGLILNRELNACVVPAFIVTSRSVASAATAKAKKPNTNTAADATPQTAPKSSTGGRTKATATTTKAAGKTGSTTKQPATPQATSKKPIKKGAAKQELTDEQKKKLLIKKLKEKALDPPPRFGINGYALWFGKEMKEKKKPISELAVAWNALPQDVKNVCLSFRIYLAAPNSYSWLFTDNLDTRPTSNKLKKQSLWSPRNTPSGSRACHPWSSAKPTMHVVV